jgi:hypothetical protein
MFKQSFDAYACDGDAIECQADGFDIVARIVYDDAYGIDDDDSHNVNQEVTGCNDSQQVALLAARDAWAKSEWFYCGVVLAVAKNDVMLDKHAVSLWGIECNYPSGNNSYLTEIANELLPEAVEAGHRILAKLKE